MTVINVSRRRESRIISRPVVDTHQLEYADARSGSAAAEGRHQRHAAKRSEPLAGADGAGVDPDALRKGRSSAGRMEECHLRPEARRGWCEDILHNTVGYLRLCPGAGSPLPWGPRPRLVSG